MGFELGSLILDKRLWRGPLLWVIALLVLANYGAHRWYQWLLADRQRTFGVAANIHKAQMSPGPHRYECSMGEEPQKYWGDIPDATRVRLVIHSGMSQTFTVNDGTADDLITCEIMDDALAGRGTRVFGCGAPNQCGEETLFQLIAMTTSPKTTPAVFLHAVCFDKFRNVDLRPGYANFLASRPEFQKAWIAAAQKYAAKYPQACEKMKSTLAAIEEEHATKEVSLESKLREGIGRFSPLVSARKELNAYSLGLAFAFRNMVLNIKPTSKRPVIESRYEMNKQFLKMLVDIGRDNGTVVVLYVIPLNPQAENPYVPEEYAAFKKWMADYTTSEKVPYANLEGIVPLDEWGHFMGGPDFKHFKEAGHRRTAAALIEHFKPWLVSASASREGRPR